MLFCSFAPKYLFFKPPILNKYRADFGIVTPRNELLLIEIERPQMRLQNRDGHMHHEATHAFGQLRDWRYDIDIDRDGFLRLISNCPRDIVRVRYMLIAGRDLGDDREMARKLISTSDGVEFMTFDHLLQTARASTGMMIRPFVSANVSSE